MSNLWLFLFRRNISDKCDSKMTHHRELKFISAMKEQTLRGQCLLHQALKERAINFHESELIFIILLSACPWAKTADGKRITETVKSIKSVVDHYTDRWIFIWICPSRSRQRLEQVFRCQLLITCPCMISATLTLKSNVSGTFHAQTVSVRANAWFIPDVKDSAWSRENKNHD